MKFRCAHVVLSLVPMVALLGWMGALGAQQPETTTPAADPAAATTADAAAPPAGTAAPEAGKPVVVQRKPVHLLPRERYQIPLALEAARTVRVLTPIGGTVREVRHKPGDKAEAQAESVRLDSVEQQLVLDRAKANYRAAQIELKRAQSGNDADLVELAEARLAAAKADLDLASFHLEQTSIRIPFNSEVFRVEVTAGQVVRPGDVMLTVGDTSQLKVELPVDRSGASLGLSTPFRVENADAQGKVESLLPPKPGFEPLRELVGSLATGVVLLENAGGKFKVGQTVYSPLVPRDPVVEIPNSAVANTPTGGRKVQVVRGNVVRDVPVEIRGGVGTDRSFVSGAFDDGDEVVVSTSHELPDGTLLRPHVGPVGNGAGTTAESGSTAPAQPRVKLSPSKGSDNPPKKTGF